MKDASHTYTAQNEYYKLSWNDIDDDDDAEEGIA